MTVISANWMFSMLFVLGALKPATSSPNQGSNYCEFYDESCSDSEEGCLDKEKCILDDPSARNHCFVTWRLDKKSNTTIVTQKGCFLEGTECYDKPDCVDRSVGRRGNIFFCCCSGDMCNRNYAWIPKEIEPVGVKEVGKSENKTEVTSQVDEAESRNAVMLIPVGALVIVVLVTTCWYFKYGKSNKSFTDPEAKQDGKMAANKQDSKMVAKGDSKMASKEDSTMAAKPSLGPIELLEVKARGNFGAVWKARTTNDVVVAAKVFATHHVQSWQTELEVLSLPHMDHECLLELMGVDKREDNLQNELWLITAYHEKGSLGEYLKTNVLTWPELCRIAETMMRGLSHLHEEIPADKATGFKPAIAHRDFKSQNILLKDDMSVCIADFGLSLVFHTDKPSGNVHSQVGTWRYMAPEVLQGAINFSRDSFLRIDMYACSLVLWELATRCTIVEANPPKYRLPFEEEVGHRPTLDDMLNVVIHKGQRPQILPNWRSHPLLAALCDTIEECWDLDSEARPSASCVLDRLLSFGRDFNHGSTTCMWIEDENSVETKKSDVFHEKEIV